MTLLFGRTYTLTTGTTKWTGDSRTGLNIRFRIKRDLKPTPNAAKIEIWNLAPASIDALVAGTPVQLDAGYRDGSGTIFLGKIDTAKTRRDGAERITEIEAGDGNQEVRLARTPPTTLGDGAANANSILDAATKGLASAGLSVLPLPPVLSSAVGKFGMALTGSSASILETAARSTGAEWSIQSGKVQVLARGQALAGTAIVLDETHGLVGTPTVETKGKTKGRTKARMLIQEDVCPGRLVVLTSSTAKGNFRIESAEYLGEYRGNDWYVDLEMGPF